MSFWLNHIDLADAKSARFVYEPALYLLSTSVFVRLFLVYVQFSKVPRVNPLRELTRQVLLANASLANLRQVVLLQVTCNPRVP